MTISLSAVWLFWGLNVSTLFVVYVFFVRPLLKINPKFRDLYAQEASVVGATRRKVRGIKQKLTSAFIYGVCSFITMYDSISPQLTGVDVTPLTNKITAHVPQWAWPIIIIGFTALLSYFRILADRRHRAPDDQINNSERN